MGLLRSETTSWSLIDSFCQKGKIYGRRKALALSNISFLVSFQSLKFSILHSSLFTLHSSLFTLHFSLFTLHSSLFTLHLIPPLSRLSNCPALPCSPKSFISNRCRVFEMSELEKPVRLTISPGLKASNTRMQMRYSLLLMHFSFNKKERNVGKCCSTRVTICCHSSFEGLTRGLSAISKND
jgi:hypothetical protein